MMSTETTSTQAQRSPQAGLTALRAYRSALAGRERDLARGLSEGLRELQECRSALAEQYQVAAELQDMLQPPFLPAAVTGGVRATARCHSAEPGLSVGGDWYLSLPLPSGDVFLAVGDVEGHGRDSVAAMAWLRYTMAALAWLGYPPRAILAALNAMLTAGGRLTATAMAVRCRPGPGGAGTATLTWACAGHPPMLARIRGAVRELPSPDGPALGVLAAAHYAHLSRDLRPGDAIALYTDGVLGRHQSPDGAINVLAEVLRADGDARAALLDGLDYAAGGDDACVLVAELTGR